MAAGEGMSFGIFADQRIDIECFIGARRVEPVAENREQNKGDTRCQQYAQDLINNECGYNKAAPAQKISDADNDTFTTLRTELADKMSTFAGNYIMTASYGDAEWNAWVETAMKDYGDALLAILNK